VEEATDPSLDVSLTGKNPKEVKYKIIFLQ
jgi:hypothetical protein